MQHEQHNKTQEMIQKDVIVTKLIQYDTIRYDTMRLINVRSKADRTDTQSQKPA